MMTAKSYFITELPLFSIFIFLDNKDLVNFSMSSKEFNKVIFFFFLDLVD
jgi:hypothetical protein